VHSQTFEELVSMNDMAIGNKANMARFRELGRPAGDATVPPLRRAASQGGSMK